MTTLYFPFTQWWEAMEGLPFMDRAIVFGAVMDYIHGKPCTEKIAPALQVLVNLIKDDIDRRRERRAAAKARREKRNQERATACAEAKHGQEKAVALRPEAGVAKAEVRPAKRKEEESSGPKFRCYRRRHVTGEWVVGDRFLNREFACRSCPPEPPAHNAWWDPASEHWMLPIDDTPAPGKTRAPRAGGSGR